MKQTIQFIVVIAVIVGGIVGLNSVYTVSPTEQVIITQFGKLVGEPIVEPGLHFKIPFTQDLNVIEKRILDWDGRPTEMATKDKTYIVVDTFGRWKISDAKKFFLSLNNENKAIQKIDNILRSETQAAIAKHELIEVIRTSKDRVSSSSEIVDGSPTAIGTLYSIKKGRALIEKEIIEASAPKLAEFGIELLDVRFKRINYNNIVRRNIYARMISERQQIAERFRSEGAGEAAKITGRRERDLQEIESEAYKTVLEIRGRADAKATEIYASAYNKSEAAIDFYEFIKTLEAYETMLAGDTTLVLTTDSDLFKYLKSVD